MLHHVSIKLPLKKSLHNLSECEVCSLLEQNKSRRATDLHVIDRWRVNEKQIFTLLINKKSRSRRSSLYWSMKSQRDADLCFIDWSRVNEPQIFTLLIDEESTRSRSSRYCSTPNQILINDRWFLIEHTVCQSEQNENSSFKIKYIWSFITCPLIGRFGQFRDCRGHY